MDLIEELEKRGDFGRELSAELQRALARMHGSADQAQWRAEDGWIIIYTTSRVDGGQHHGKFLTQAFKPYGRGARTKPRQWKCVYERAFSTRKAAKKRAVDLYGQHSPKWLARRG